VKPTSDLVKFYTLGEFEGSVARMNKSKKYYDDHVRALEAQREQEFEDGKEDRKKMLHLAEMMQYEDDFDDQNFYAEKNRRRRDSDDEKPKILSASKRTGDLDVDEDEDDLVDEYEKVLEGQEQDEDNEYLFQDDEKQQRRIQQERAREEEKKQQERT